MGDLDEAIRDHLELKRRRGADPAEVAREEQDALSPVTRSHAVVVPEQLPAEPEDEVAPPQSHNGDADHHDEAAAPSGEEDLGDATQEFRVEYGDSSEDWLDDGEE
jgi:hypothetical protein